MLKYTKVWQVISIATSGASDPSMPALYQPEKVDLCDRNMHDSQIHAFHRKIEYLYK